MGSALAAVFSATTATEPSGFLNAVRLTALFELVAPIRTAPGRTYRRVVGERPQPPGRGDGGAVDLDEALVVAVLRRGGAAPPVQERAQAGRGQPGVDVLRPGQAGRAGAVVPGRVPGLERGPLGLPGRLGPAGQRRGRSLGVAVAGEHRGVGARRGVGLDGAGVLLRVIPALSGAALHLGGQAGGRQGGAEHVQEAGRLRRAELHAVVAGGQVGLVLRADVGQRVPGGRVVPGVLHQVVRVRLAPVTAGAGRTGQAAHRAAVVRRVVGLHERRRAPRVREHVGHPVVGLDLLGEPQLARVLADRGQRHVGRGRRRAGRRGGLDGAAGVSADLVAQHGQPGPRSRAVQQAQRLLLHGRGRVHHRLGLAERLGRTEPRHGLVRRGAVDDRGVLGGRGPGHGGDAGPGQQERGRRGRDT